MFDWNNLGNCSTWILYSKYEQVDINKVANDQKHLTPNQHLDLQKIMAKYKNLFDGSLGVYPQKKDHIDILSGTVPVHYRVYPVPCAHEQTFKKNYNT